MALTTNDAKVIFGMINRGDKKHDIASWFGENPARIAEVEDGVLGHPEPAAPADLPPKGAPGPKGRRLRGAVKNAITALEKGDADGALTMLQDGLAKYNKNEA